jgi:hypothetical protein
VKIRQIALNRFSEKNIPPRTTMASLEEVLVPGIVWDWGEEGKFYPQGR